MNEIKIDEIMWWFYYSFVKLEMYEEQIIDYNSLINETDKNLNCEVKMIYLYQGS